MSNLYAPFRYDYVGSFLRPAELKKARADYEAGAITIEQLKIVEDRCITELIAKQKAVDLKMEISFIGVLNYSQDDLFQTEFTTEIKELSIEYDIQNRKKDIARIQPDILLSNYSNTDLTGSFFADTIPLCPQAGFLSGLSLAGRWGEFFRMNLREGWKDDAALYEKYNA